jgi:hypothetical protein
MAGEKCPNKNTKEWKNMVHHVGEFEANRAFIAHNETLPNAIGMTELKKKIGLTGGLYSEARKIGINKRIRSFNKKNGTSHRIVYKQIGESQSFTGTLVFNYMPVNKAAQEDRDQRRKMEGYQRLRDMLDDKPFDHSESEKEAGQFNDEGDFMPPSYLPATEKRRAGPKFQDYITSRKEDLHILYNKRSKLKIQKQTATTGKAKNLISLKLEAIKDKIEETEGKLLELENLNRLDEIEVYALEDMDTLADIFAKANPTLKELEIAGRLIKVWQRAGEFSGNEPHIFYDPEEFADKFEGLAEITDKFLEWKKQADGYNLRLLELREKVLRGELEETLGDTGIDFNQPLSNVSNVVANVLDISETDNVVFQAMHAWVHDANFAAKRETDGVFEELDRLIKATGLTDFSIFQQTASNIDDRLTGDMVFRWSQAYFEWNGAVTRKRKGAIDNAFKDKNDKRAYQTMDRANREYIEEQRKNTLVFDPRLLSEFYDSELTDAPAPTEKQSAAHEAKLRELLGDEGYEEYYNVNRRKIEDYKIALAARRSLAESEYGENLAAVEDQVSAWVAKNSPYLYAEALEKGYDAVMYKNIHINPSNQFVRSVPKRIVNGEDSGYYDNKYQQIQDNDSYLELYKYMLDLMKTLKLYLPNERVAFMQMNSIPIISKKVIEAMSEGGLAAGFSQSKDALLEAIRTDDLSTLGTPEDKKELQLQHLINNNQRIRNYIELKDTEYRAAKNEAPTEDMVNEWRKDARHLFAQEKSFDLGRVMKAFASMAITYKHKATIEDQMRIAEDIVKTSLAKRQNASGEELRDKYGNLLTDKGLRNLKDMLDNFMEVAYWGYPSNRAEGKFGKKKVLTSKEKELQVLLEKSKVELDELLAKDRITQDEYDNRLEVVQDQLDILGGVKAISKFGDVLLKYIQLKGMGWNVFAAFANMGFGIISNVVEASDGRNYSAKNFWKAQALTFNSVGRNYSFNTWDGLNGNAKKIRSLMNLYDTLKEARNEIYQSVAPSMFKKIGDRLEWANPYSPQSRSEYFNQAPVMIAMMMETTIEIDGKQVNLWDAYNKDGKLPEGVEFSEKSMSELKRRIDKLVKMNHGNYDPDSPLLIKRKWFGRALSQFRTWAFQGFAERFRSEFDDYQLVNQITGENYVTRKGRYRSYLAYFSVENPHMAVGATFKLTLQLLRKLVGFNTQFDNMVREGFDETDAANMRKNMTEIVLWLVITSITLALKAGIDDDDDKDKARVLASNFLINQMARLGTDIAFYSNPVEFERLARNAIPAFSLVVDAQKAIGSAMTLITEGQEADILQSGPNKGESRTWRDFKKMIPGPVQYQKLQSATEQIYKKN